MVSDVVTATKKTYSSKNQEAQMFARNKLTLITCLAGMLSMSAAAMGPTNTKTYQVTGPIVSMDDSTITVQKGSEKFEMARDSSTKATGDLKVGDKVTVKYAMTATEIESKAGKAASKKGAK